MRFLAIEASTSAASVALWQDGAISQRLAPRDAPSSSSLLPLIGELLAAAATGIAGLDAISFAAGPGAFTGLRVACSLAQGLALPHDLPVLPLGTLDVLVEASGVGGSVLACLDARMGEVYCAAFAAGQALGEPAVLAPENVRLPASCGPWSAVGNGLAAYPVIAASLGLPAAAIYPAAAPDAAALARLAAPRLLAGAGIDAALAAPLYVRNKVALTTAERLTQQGA